MTISASHADHPAHAHSHSPWLIANLMAQMAFGLLAMTLCLPSMQAWGAIFALDQAHVQLTFSGLVVAYGGLQLVCGPLSDRHGRKAILLVCLLMAGVASALTVFSTNIR
jgi:DHA1 family bicyclomycin/chloramphenicol resistance-like MFS transporter